MGLVLPGLKIENNTLYSFNNSTAEWEPASVTLIPAIDELVARLETLKYPLTSTRVSAVLGREFTTTQGRVRAFRDEDGDMQFALHEDMQTPAAMASAAVDSLNEDAAFDDDLTVPYLGNQPDNRQAGAEAPPTKPAAAQSSTPESVSIAIAISDDELIFDNSDIAIPIGIAITLPPPLSLARPSASTAAASDGAAKRLRAARKTVFDPETQHPFLRRTKTPGSPFVCAARSQVPVDPRFLERPEAVPDYSVASSGRSVADGQPLLSPPDAIRSLFLNPWRLSLAVSTLQPHDMEFVFFRKAVAVRRRTMDGFLLRSRLAYLAYEGLKMALESASREQVQQRFRMEQKNIPEEEIGLISGCDPSVVVDFVSCMLIPNLKFYRIAN